MGESIPPATVSPAAVAAPVIALAGGIQGPSRLDELIPLALNGFAAGLAERGAAAPAGGPAAVAAGVAAASHPGLRTGAPAPETANGTWPSFLLPAEGVGAEHALGELTRLLAAGSVDPADPWCAAHLHCPPLAVAVAADVVAGALNPSMDSWDQAPVASELEREFTTAIARLCYPDADRPDAVVTTGGTESNLLGLLLARERDPAVRPVCARTAHHSVGRAAWLLGLPAPAPVESRAGRLCPRSLATTLAALPGPAVVVATAGTTDTGAIDPLTEIAAVCRRFGAQLHVDAAYGGMALCSPQLRPLLAGLEQADSVTLDMHKFGWQPISAGLFACREAQRLSALSVRAEYLNPEDDTEAGMPDLLGRSIRTSRRPDSFRMAVTMRALGTEGMGALVRRCCGTAAGVAARIDAHPGLRLWGTPELSTVLFRPAAADELADELDERCANELVAGVRRTLLESGVAVLGRATMPEPGEPGPGEPGQVWLKLTLLHPNTVAADYQELLELVVRTAAEGRAELVPGAVAAS